MKSFTKFKLLTILGLCFFIFSSEKGCQDPRENEDLYGPEDEINSGWEESVLGVPLCDIEDQNINDLLNSNTNNWLKSLIQDQENVSKITLHKSNILDEYYFEILVNNEGDYSNVISFYNCEGNLICEDELSPAYGDYIIACMHSNGYINIIGDDVIDEIEL